MDELGLGMWVDIAGIRSCAIHGDFGDFGGPFLLRLLLGFGPLASSWGRHGDLNCEAWSYEWGTGKLLWYT